MRIVPGQRPGVDVKSHSNVSFSIKIHPDQVFSAVEALEQIALQMPAIDRFPDHFFLLIVPHRIVQYLLQHTQGPQFPGTHMAQVGAVAVSYTHLDVYKRQGMIYIMGVGEMEQHRAHPVLCLMQMCIRDSPRIGPNRCSVLSHFS